MVDLSKFPRGDPARRERSNIAPNATWLLPASVAAHVHWQYETGKIFLGEIDGTLIGVRDDRHLMTIAGSRSGKGTSAIVPNLLLYPGSILCIDPKGENAAITAAQRRVMGQQVYVLDPFGASGLPSAAFNPLDSIDVDVETCVDDAALIADALIMSDGKEDRHFPAAARNLLRGLILYIAAHEPPGQRHLIRVRELLTAPNKEFTETLTAMMGSHAAFGVIARAGGAMDKKEDREFSGVLSTAIEQTDFLDSPPMKRVLERSDFTLFDLKRERITIFLCLPAGRMATHNRWLRIFINLVLESLERLPAAPELPVLMILDEFPILGHLESIEKAAGLIAGFGVRLWPIIQDLPQLQRHYEKSWETFIGNAGVLQVFGNSDMTTLKYISERLGQSTVINVGKGEISQQQAASGFSGENQSSSIAPLMTTEEIGRFFSRQSGQQILLWPGVNPIAANRVEYHKHTLFHGKFTPRGG